MKFNVYDLVRIKGRRELFTVAGIEQGDDQAPDFVMLADGDMSSLYYSYSSPTSTYSAYEPDLEMVRKFFPDPTRRRYMPRA